VPLTIYSANGNHRFTVEVAATFDQQETGLMFRRSVPANHGMIFPYDPPAVASFWMKNTLVPLDILFIGVDHRIAYIAANAPPLSLDPISGHVPVTGVLELRGGRSAELGIKVGDRVSWHS
jgi:uncharacterized membrane protein (UPF0127 family)